MLDWVLVLYGTAIHPLHPPVTTTTTTTSATTTRRTRHKQRHKPRPKTTPRFRTLAKLAPTTTDITPMTTEEHSTVFKSRGFNLNTPVHTKSASARHKLPIPKNHVCIFETLAKRTNMSALQYMRMISSNLSSGKPLTYDVVLVCLSLLS